MRIEIAKTGDVQDIMGWFPDKESVILWGSPYTRYPLSKDTFFEDIYWERIVSCVARDDDGTLMGFGQFYPKLGRCHLARLVLNPAYRGRGLGVKFIGMLMKHGAAELGTSGFSLYVMTFNKPAYRCYKALGFHMAPYPHGDAKLENCVFMTAEANDEQQ